MVEPKIESGDVKNHSLNPRAVFSMSIINNLRKQASDRQAEEEAAAKRQTQLKEYYQQEIQPRLIGLYRNMLELVQHLNYLQPDVRVMYPFNAEGNRLQLSQANYVVEIDSLDNTQDIAFSCRCKGKRELLFQTGDPQLVDKHEDFLKHYNFKYQCRRHKNEKHQVIGADFSVATDIAVRLRFQADIENQCVRLTVVNLPNLGSRHFQLRPRQLDDPFLDELGRFILRENDEFLSLDISDTEKECIRQQLQKEIQERQAELEHNEPLEEKPTGFFQKIKF